MPGKYQLMVLLAAWCGLRFGELAEMRRTDVDVTNGVVHVRRGVVYYPARDKAGRPDLRFHDLRHTAAVLAASTGATLAELMARLGHSTPGAALRYQHAAKDHDRVTADALSKLVTGDVTPIEAAGTRAKSSRRRSAS